MISVKTIGIATLTLRINHFAPIVKRKMQHEFDRKAEDAVAAMQERVNVEKGALRDSIRWEQNTEEHSAGIKITAGGVPETQHADHKNGLVYDEALLLEFGTVHEEAQPFFRPVVREVFGEGEAENIKANIGKLDEVE
jgi:HK97 gp10 family phage protein